MDQYQSGMGAEKKIGKSWSTILPHTIDRKREKLGYMRISVACGEYFLLLRAVLFIYLAAKLDDTKKCLSSMSQKKDEMRA